MRNWILALNALLVAWLFFAPTGFKHLFVNNYQILPIADNYAWVAIAVGLLTIAALSIGPKSPWSVFAAYLIIAVGVWQFLTPFVLGTGGQEKAWVTSMVSGALIVVFTSAWLLATQNMRKKAA